MTTGNEKFIIDQMNPMTTEEARKALTNGKFGPTSSEDYRFACSVLARKESDFREATELETLTISRKALQASDDANKLARDANSIASKARSDARRANIIAIIAIALSVIIAIVGQLLTKK